MGPVSSKSKNESKYQMAKPLFPNLPDLPHDMRASIMILSFFGHEDLVKVLLRMLNRNSYLYYNYHKPQLMKNLVCWQPEILVLDFGNEYLDWTS